MQSIDLFWWISKNCSDYGFGGKEGMSALGRTITELRSIKSVKINFMRYFYEENIDLTIINAKWMIEFDSFW